MRLLDFKSLWFIPEHFLANVPIDISSVSMFFIADGAGGRGTEAVAGRSAAGRGVNSGPHP